MRAQLAGANEIIASAEDHLKGLVAEREKLQAQMSILSGTGFWSHEVDQIKVWFDAVSKYVGGI